MTTNSIAEDRLQQLLRELISEALQSGAAERWKGRDPYHLFHIAAGDDIRLIGEPYPDLDLLPGAITTRVELADGPIEIDDPIGAEFNVRAPVEVFAEGDEFDPMSESRSSPVEFQIPATIEFKVSIALSNLDINHSTVT